MTSDEILYKQFRNNPVCESKKFLKWFKEKYKMDPHHLIGSMWSKKLNDYLCVPVTQEIHAEAEAHKQQFFINNLHISVRILCEYVQEMERK